LRVAKIVGGRLHRLARRVITRRVYELRHLLDAISARQSPWVTETALEQTLTTTLFSAGNYLNPHIQTEWSLVLSESLRQFETRWVSPSALHPISLADSKNRWESNYQGKTVPLRRDQILSAIHWGVGFETDPTPTAYGLLKRLTEEDLLFVIRDVRDVAHIWSRFSPDGAKLRQRDINWNQVHPFERLITDILNEEVFVAHRASRDEDFFELTDIRVRYPELARRHGARLQVTLIQSERRLSEKIERIRLPEELILLSSHSLSGWFKEHTDHRLTAADVQSHFRFAMAYPVQHPAGPSQLLPDWFRDGIRQFVKSEAIRTTQALRDRQGRK
jgi:hypothetical protein